MRVCFDGAEGPERHGALQAPSGCSSGLLSCCHLAYEGVEAVDRRGDLGVQKCEAVVEISDCRAVCANCDSFSEIDVRSSAWAWGRRKFNGLIASSNGRQSFDFLRSIRYLKRGYEMRRLCRFPDLQRRRNQRAFWLAFKSIFQRQWRNITDDCRFEFGVGNLIV